MNFARDLKRKWMVPGMKMTATAYASAATYGSGGNTTKGVVDTRGYDWVRIEVTKSTAAAATKLFQCLLAFQSGAATLIASALNASGGVSGASGRVLTSSTLSAACWAFDINLAAHAKRKRYMTAKIGGSGTSQVQLSVAAYLHNGESFAPSTTGYTAFTQIG